MPQSVQPTALALTLSSGSYNLVGKNPEFPYQSCSQPCLLCMLVNALIQPGVAHLQSNSAAEPSLG